MLEWTMSVGLWVGIIPTRKKENHRKTILTL